MSKILLTVLLMLGMTMHASAADYEEGTHYKRVDNQPASSDGGIEVLEFFWYGCPHCYSFEPYLNKWKDAKPEDVKLTRVPATFYPSWQLHARAYYALQMMGELEDLHGRFFSAMHNDKKRLDSIDAIADFVSEYGVDRSEFIDSINSFAVETSIRKATNLIKQYNISGVPAVAVNGKYLVSAKLAGSYENMIRIMNYLIEKESAEAAAPVETRRLAGHYE